MNTEEIIRMAREAGFDEWQSKVLFDHLLERFAQLVAAAEREACAKLCRTFAHEAEGWSFADAACFKKAADMIRARGNE